MNNKSKYCEMPLQTISKKVWSSFIDGLLLLVLGVILTLTASFSVLRNNDVYIQNHNQCFSSIEEMYKILDESKLQKLSSNNNRKVLATADYFDIYIDKQIKLSYLNFKEDFNKQGISLEIKDSNYSTLENDELAYYYLEFKIKNNINIDDYQNKTPLDYYKEEIFFKNINKDYYVDQEDNLPIIKSDIAIKLYKHYSDIEYSKDLYNEFQDSVLAIRNIGLNDIKSYDVFNEHYLIYEASYDVMSKYSNIALLLTFIMVYVIVVVIPSLVTKDGLTLGKLLTNTRTICEDDSNISKLRIFLTSLVGMIINIFIIVFISLFTFGFENLTLSVFNIGSLNISFLFLLLFSFLLMIINFIIIAATIDHRSLIDIITKTKQMDTSTYIEINKD